MYRNRCKTMVLDIHLIPLDKGGGGVHYCIAPLYHTLCVSLATCVHAFTKAAVYLMDF